MLELLGIDLQPTLIESTICFSVKPKIIILSSNGVISEISLVSIGPCEKCPLIFPALRIAISVPNSDLIASAIKFPCGLFWASLFSGGGTAAFTCPIISGFPMIPSTACFTNKGLLYALVLITLFWAFLITPFSSKSTFSMPTFSPSFPAWVIIVGSPVFE